MEKTNRATCNTRLRRARELRNWSQERLASELDTTSKTVSRWERGESWPMPHFREQLCLVFELSASELGLDAALTGASGLSAPAERPAQLAPLYDPLVPLPVALEGGLVGREAEAAAIMAPPAVEPPVIDPLVPFPLTRAGGLVGRDDLLRTFKARLCTENRLFLAALNGIPGVGKTSLATALAQDPEVHLAFPDGILWAGLGPQSNVQGILARWGALFGMRQGEMAQQSAEETWGMALRLRIGTRRILLVIDDAWLLEDALALRVGGPHCAYVLTTRFPEVASRFAGTDVILVEELGEEDGLALLGRLAPAVLEVDLEGARELVRAVGCLPLALVIIGNYLRVQSSGGQPRRIRQALKRLWELSEQRMLLAQPQAVIESHPSLPSGAFLSLQAVIGASVSLLEQPVKRTLFALAVLPSKPSTFSEGAALATADTRVEALDRLSDVGLLESGGPGRYALHQTITDYACLQGQDQGAGERLVDYIAGFVAAHKSDYDTLEVEMAVVLAALGIAYAQRAWQVLLRIVDDFLPYLLIRGQYVLAESLLQQGRTAAQALEDSQHLVRVLIFLGNVAQKQGDYARAEAVCQEGLLLTRRHGLVGSTCELIAKLGWLSEKRGDYDQAESYLQESYALARQYDLQEQTCSILVELAGLADSRGLYDDADAYNQDALDLAQLMGDRERISSALISLAIGAVRRGADEQAEQYYREGLDLARHIGYREQICYALTGLGELAVRRGTDEQAEQYYREGLDLARHIGHRELISGILANLGAVARERGALVDAEAYLRESLDLARLLGHHWIMNSILLELGELQLVQQDLTAAETTFREILQILPEGSQELLALVEFGLARVQVGLGNSSEARRLGEASLKRFDEIGNAKGSAIRHWLESISAPDVASPAVASGGIHVGNVTEDGEGTS